MFLSPLFLHISYSPHHDPSLLILKLRAEKKENSYHSHLSTSRISLIFFFSSFLLAIFPATSRHSVTRMKRGMSNPKTRERIKSYCCASFFSFQRILSTFTKLSEENSSLDLQDAKLNSLKMEICQRPRSFLPVVTLLLNDLPPMKCF